MRALHNGNQTEQSYIKNCTGIGNYQTSEKMPTGNKNTYQMKNIYDLAGNVKEWTMEQYGETGKVARGRKLSRRRKYQSSICA